MFFVVFFSNIGIRKNPCQTVNTAPSHRPPMLGDCTHFLAMIHLPCYMYDTSTVTLSSRTPYLPNGAFCSHSGLLWKDPTKEGPWDGFHLLFFLVIERRQLSHHRNLLKMTKKYTYFSRYLLKEECRQKETTTLYQNKQIKVSVFVFLCLLSTVFPPCLS